MKILHSIIFGEGEPLLILHGYFGMSDNWKSLGKMFSESFEVHLIDQRNHGRSFHTDEFGYDYMVEDLMNYIQHHQLDKINLLGHSMGGKTAMLFATTYPEYLNKLMVADIAPKYYPPHHQVLLEGLHAVNFDLLTSRSQIDDVLSEYIPEIAVRQFLTKNVYRKLHDGFGFRFNLESLSRNNNEIGEALPSTSIFLGKTLFLKGENSGYISVNDEQIIREHFPDSKIITIKNSGHWLHSENPLEFYENIIEFLKK